SGLKQVGRGFGTTTCPSVGLAKLGCKSRAAIGIARLSVERSLVPVSSMQKRKRRRSFISCALGVLRALGELPRLQKMIGKAFRIGPSQRLQYFSEAQMKPLPLR